MIACQLQVIGSSVLLATMPALPLLRMLVVALHNWCCVWCELGACVCFCRLCRQLVNAATHTCVLDASCDMTLAAAQQVCTGSLLHRHYVHSQASDMPDRQALSVLEEESFWFLTAYSLLTFSQVHCTIPSLQVPHSFPVLSHIDIINKAGAAAAVATASQALEQQLPGLLQQVGQMCNTPADAMVCDGLMLCIVCVW
jgi:hypothetical protein